MSVSVIEGSGLRRPRRIRPVPSCESSAPANHAPAPDDRPKGFREWGVAAGSSILLHLLLVLLLAVILIVLPGSSSGSGLVIQSSISPGDPQLEQLDSVKFETPALEDLALDGMEVSDIAAEVASLDARADRLDSVEFKPLTRDEMPLDGMDVSDVVAKVASLKPRLNGVNFAEQAGGQPRRRGAELSKVSFFGTEEWGESFVFVVDASGSMSKTTNDTPRSRFTFPPSRFVLALEELKKSLDDLKTWQMFGIIFYNGNPIPLYTPEEGARLYLATAEEREKAVKWMSQLSPRDNTYPQEALRQALELQPDVVFFLTDGEIPRETRDVVKQANRHKTIVHTVALSSREGEAVLQGIAEDNRGRYRYVP